MSKAQEMPSVPNPRPPAVPDASGSEPNLQKNPLLAAGLNFFPGLGQVYNGLYLRGLLNLILVVGLFNLVDRSGTALFGFLGGFFLLGGILDAYRQATLINLGYAHDLGLTDRPEAPQARQAGIAVGIILFGVGLLATLDEFFRLDFDWIVRFWPLGMMAIGAWIVFSSLKKKDPEPSDDIDLFD